MATVTVAPTLPPMPIPQLSLAYFQGIVQWTCPHCQQRTKTRVRYATEVQLQCPNSPCRRRLWMQFTLEPAQARRKRRQQR
jgi:hypothetical protein